MESLVSPSRDEIVEQVKQEWRSLWQERYDDKVRAEGVSSSDYALLFVEKGLVICATRKFKELNLRAILGQHGIGGVDRVVPPDPAVGGWGKFIRTNLVTQGRGQRARQMRRELEAGKKRQQRKQGGRGWLHI